MGLRRKKQLKRPGLPEVMVAVLGITLLAFTVCWAHARERGVYFRASGAVTACEIEDTHVNAPPSEKKIALAYEYTVAGKTFPGYWVGYWPTGHSPNALPLSAIDKLKTKGYPLTVYYNPARPDESYLHESGTGERLVFSLLTLLCGGGLVAYLLWLYPALRR